MQKHEDDGRNDIVANLIALSRESIAEGDGHNALALVLDAIRMTQGEGAIMSLLDQAKRKADEDIERQRTITETRNALQICNSLSEAETILAERGDEDILVDAFKDGSSVVCQRCNSLIPKARTEQHRLYWCQESTV